MKKYYVNFDEGLYENPSISEEEFDKFETASNFTVIGYDGDEKPKGCRFSSRGIRAVYFKKMNLFDTREEAESYMNQTFKDMLAELEKDLKKIQTKVRNIKNNLSRLDEADEADEEDNETVYYCIDGVDYPKEEFYRIIKERGEI